MSIKREMAEYIVLGKKKRQEASIHNMTLFCFKKKHQSNQRKKLLKQSKKTIAFASNVEAGTGMGQCLFTVCL